MKHNRAGYLLKEGFKSIFTHGFMSFACILVIVACLLIMGNFALLAVNIDYNIQDLESRNETLAFVNDALSEEEARELQAHLRSLDNVANVEFISREEAMANFISQYEDESQFSDVTPSWFRHRYVIYMNDLSLLSETTAAIRAVYGIQDVSDSLELAQGIITVRNIVDRKSGV